jgi:hypothetical protein
LQIEVCSDQFLIPIQTASIAGKSISENILLAQEMVRNYHKDKGIPRCTIKLDLLKADDSLEWEFTLHCQSTIGIPQKLLIGLERALLPVNFPWF